MPKVTLSTIDTLRNDSTAVAALNANFTTLATAIENTLSRDGTSPNGMSSNFDVNGYKIVNVAQPVNPTDAVRFQDLAEQEIELGTQVTAATTQATNAAASATAAAASATAAAASETAAETAETNAETAQAAAEAAQAIAEAAVATYTGIQYTFNSSTTASDPGAGIFRFNNATLSSVTAIYIDNVDADGVTVTDWIDSWDASTSSDKGVLLIKSITDGSIFALFTVTAVADSTGYRTVTVTYVDGNGTFSGDFGLLYSYKGDKGDTGPGSGDLLAANNLSDLGNASTARSNLGVAIGSNVQAYDSDLAAIASLTSAADRLPYYTGSGTAALATFTSFGRSLVDDADASAARTTLGLGSLATASTINDANWSGTALAVANGGTGATTAAGARTNLGLGSLATLSTINNSNWSGTDLAVANGGTGTSTQGALDGIVSTAAFTISSSDYMLVRDSTDAIWKRATLSSVIQALLNTIGSTKGNILYRATSTWAALAPP